MISADLSPPWGQWTRYSARFRAFDPLCDWTLYVIANGDGVVTVTASIDVNSVLATLPEYGMGSTRRFTTTALRYDGLAYNLLDGPLDDAGIDVLRYPGGGYADGFHFSTRPAAVMTAA